MPLTTGITARPQNSGWFLSKTEQSQISIIAKQSHDVVLLITRCWRVAGRLGSSTRKTGSLGCLALGIQLGQQEDGDGARQLQDILILYLYQVKLPS